MAKKIIINEEQIKRIIAEENLTKNDVTKVIANFAKTDKEFERRVKNIAADVVKQLFKTLWQKNGIYDHDIRQ